MPDNISLLNILSLYYVGSYELQIVVFASLEHCWGVPGQVVRGSDPLYWLGQVFSEWVGRYFSPLSR